MCTIAQSAIMARAAQPPGPHLAHLTSAFGSGLHNRVLLGFQVVRLPLIVLQLLLQARDVVVVVQNFIGLGLHVYLSLCTAQQMRIT